MFGRLLLVDDVCSVAAQLLLCGVVSVTVHAVVLVSRGKPILIHTLSVTSNLSRQRSSVLWLLMKINT
jgi:hypothetical protein